MSVPDQDRDEITTMAVRPIDCGPGLRNRFIRTVMLSGEVPRDNLVRGAPMAEMLFFAGTPTALMGVTAVRYAQKAYHKSLFEQAGIPQMYNPDAVEVCWLSIDPAYRGLGIWKKLADIRTEFLGDRPYFTVQRVANKPISEKSGIRPVGNPFKAADKDHMISVGIQNHDPVYDPNKKHLYGYESN